MGLGVFKLKGRLRPLRPRAQHRCSRVSAMLSRGAGEGSAAPHHPLANTPPPISGSALTNAGVFHGIPGPGRAARRGGDEAM